MADLQPEGAVDARLRDFLAAELRRAEVDFPHLARPEPQPTSRRRPPLGILRAVVAVAAIVVFVVVVSRSLPGGFGGTGGTPDDSGSPLTSITPASPSVSGQTSVSATPSTAPSDPSESVEPSLASVVPSGSLSSGIVDCGRIAPAACAKAISLARKVPGEKVAGEERIVVDDSCPPDSLCDRQYPFDSIVVFVTAGGDTTGWYAFDVVGREDGVPTTATRWMDQVPTHIAQRIRALLASP